MPFFELKVTCSKKTQKRALAAGLRFPKIFRVWQSEATDDVTAVVTYKEDDYCDFEATTRCIKCSQYLETIYVELDNFSSVSPSKLTLYSHSPCDVCAEVRRIDLEGSDSEEPEYSLKRLILGE